MTVANPYLPNSYVASGSQAIFNFTFQIISDTNDVPDITTVQVKLNGVIQSSGFTTVANQDQEGSPGGTVTFNTDPVVGTIVEISRNTPITQLLDFPLAAKLSTAALGVEFDKTCLIVQESEYILSQAVLDSVVTVGNPIAGNLTRFNGPTEITNGDLSGDISTSGTLVTTLPNVNGNVGVFQGIAVNAKGQVTGATNQNYISGNQTITLSGDVSGSGTTAITATLPTVNSNVGSFTNANLTVNAKGQVTAVSNGAASGGGIVGAANPNGIQAGTSGQFFYDATHAVSYICTTSGSSSTAVWTRLTEAVGTIKEWWSTAAPPLGYAPCDGGTYNGVTTPNKIGMVTQGSNITGGSTAGNANGYDTAGSVPNQTVVGSITQTASGTAGGTTGGPSSSASVIQGSDGLSSGLATSSHTHTYSGSFTTSAFSTQPAAIANPFIMRVT
jgi:hypothetical protein